MRTEFDYIVTFIAAIEIVAYILDDFDNIVAALKNKFEQIFKR